MKGVIPILSQLFEHKRDSPPQVNVRPIAQVHEQTNSGLAKSEFEFYHMKLKRLLANITSCQAEI